MVKVIDHRFGVEKWVHESRLEEYLASGDTLADAPVEEAPKKPRTTRKKQ